MLLPIYIFLAALCAVLVNKRLRLDPFIIIIPCSLLALDNIQTLLSLYISLIPVAVVYACCCVFRERHNINIEAVARLGAGLSLGGFVGVQLVMLLPWSFMGLLGLLAVTTILNLIGWRYPKLTLNKIPPRLAVIAGLIMGGGQFLGLGSGMALLSGAQQHTSSANRCALWCFSLVGAAVGIIALPEGMAVEYLSTEMVVAALIGVVLGLLLLRRTQVSQFESKVLDWIVLAMCLSVWGHLFIKHIIFSS